MAPPAASQASEPPPPAARSGGQRNMLFWTTEEKLTGFKTIANIYPTRSVAHGPNVLALPKREPEPRVEFEYDGQRYDIERYMQAFHVTGVLVIKRGEIRLERYAHGRGENDPWISFSVTKSISSTLLGVALKDGSIGSLNDRVTRYIPEMSGSAYETVSLKQLLTMTSGVKWNEDYSDPKSDVAMRNWAAADAPGEPLVNYMRTLPRATTPGEHFNYSTGEADLVGVVVRRATGRPLAEYLSDRIWKPFGMEHDAVWMLHRSGHEVGGCCLSMTLRDYGRFGLFMLRAGRLADGRRVLPQDWTPQATAKHVDAYPGMGYGYLWWTPGDSSFHADGIFGQSISILPKEEVVVVVNSAWPRAVGADLNGPRRALIAALVAATQDR